MELTLGAADLVFREEARAFLDTHLSEDMRDEARRGVGVWSNIGLAVRWQKILHANGRAAPAWPVEQGGCDWTVAQHYIWELECAAAGAPRIPAMGLRMCGPVLMAFGTAAQKARFLPPMLSADEIWCQGYSEPQAGSDLASLQCKAERRGDRYLINGTKIWTTYAQHADWMFCLVRTAATPRPQEGISFLLIPMDSPGLTVAPIFTLAGEHEVNQVFFDDVEAPVELRVGEENAGWSIAKFLLQHERGGAFAAGLRRKLQDLKAIARCEPEQGGALIEEPGFALRLAALEIEIAAVELTERRLIAALSSGRPAGALPSMLKLAGTETSQRIDQMLIEAIGPYAAADYLAVREGRANWSPGPAHAVTPMGLYLNNRAATIYGGSSEVQRNIISRVHLNL